MSAPQSLPPPTIGGIWEGTNLLGWNTIGIVTEGGLFHFGFPWGLDDGVLIGTDLELMIGNASVMGNQVHGEGTLYHRRGARVGEYYRTGLRCALTGVVEERHTLTLESACEPPSSLDDGYVDLDTLLDHYNAQTSLELTYRPLYEQGASLVAVAGLYEIQLRGAFLVPPTLPPQVVRIDSNGDWFSQSTTSRGTPVCTENGHVDVLNPAYNIYSVAFNESCNPSLSGIDREWEGLATLDTSTDPNTLVYMISADYPDQPDASPVYATTVLMYGHKL